MSKKLFEDSGYLSIPAILDYGLTFNWVCGARGTGKTYGALKDAVSAERKFILMRRTQTQVDIISKNEFSPFKPLEVDGYGAFTTRKNSKYNSIVYHDDTPCATIAALSTFSNLRGFDASEIEELIFDEFIPEPHEKLIKNEAEAFANAYETINRNRELKGSPPLKVLALANSNRLDNEFFVFFNLVTTAYRMIETGQSIYIDRKRSIGLFMPNNSPISSAKEQTALYRAVSGGSSFYSMAIGNEFQTSDTELIRSLPLKEFIPLVTVGELTVWKHKSGDYYYVCEKRGGNPPIFSADTENLKRFRTLYPFLALAHIERKIFFEKYYDKILFEKYQK